MDRGITFKWSEMEKGMHVLGINQVEGLENHLHNPDKICAVMEEKRWQRKSWKRKTWRREKKWV